MSEPAPFRLTYSSVERLIATLHDVPPKRVPTLRARLKHLKRLGFPTGVNTGRGRPAAYGAGAVLQLLLAFELIELGLTPERAINLLLEFGFVVVQAAGFGSRHLTRDDEEADRQDIFLSLDPRGLASLSEPDSLAQADDPALTTVVECWTADLVTVLGESRRRAFINMSTVLLAAAAVMERDGVAKRAEFSAALFDWAETFPWRTPVT